MSESAEPEFDGTAEAPGDGDEAIDAEPGFVDVADYQRADNPSHDPLLSVEEIARQFTTDLQAIRDLVENGGIRSLDRGRLASEGKLDVPVVRLSWAKAVQKDSETAWRRLDDQRDGEIHPAAQVTIEFHTAISDGDGELARSLCVPRSVDAVDATEICSRVVARTSPALFGSGSAVATGVYSLEPIDAVAVRIIKASGPIPRRMDAPTPVTLLGVIPLKEIADEWFVDFELLGEQEALQEILQFGSSSDSISNQ